MVRFNRALTREMVAMSASAFVALAAIFVVVVLVRVLGKAAVGDLEATAVLPMLAFGVLRFMPVLLSLALFIGVFMSLSRIWRDSEAIIWAGVPSKSRPQPSAIRLSAVNTSLALGM